MDQRDDEIGTLNSGEDVVIEEFLIEDIEEVMGEGRQPVECWREVHNNKCKWVWPGLLLVVLIVIVLLLC